MKVPVIIVFFDDYILIMKGRNECDLNRFFGVKKNNSD
jgi:hypothetical protein